MKSENNVIISFDAQDKNLFIPKYKYYTLKFR